MGACKSWDIKLSLTTIQRSSLSEPERASLLCLFANVFVSLARHPALSIFTYISFYSSLSLDDFRRKRRQRYLLSHSPSSPASPKRFVFIIGVVHNEHRGFARVSVSVAVVVFGGRGFWRGLIAWGFGRLLGFGFGTYYAIQYEFRNNWKESCWRVPG